MWCPKRAVPSGSEDRVAGKHHVGEGRERQGFGREGAQWVGETVSSDDEG